MSEYGHIFQLGHDWTGDKNPLKNRYKVVYENKEWYVCVTGGDTRPQIISKNQVYSLERLHQLINERKYSFDSFCYVYVKKAKDFDIPLPVDREKYLSKQIKNHISDIESYNKLISSSTALIQLKHEAINRHLTRIAELTIELDQLKELYAKETNKEYEP